MNWQKLHDGHCPRCGNILEDHGEEWTDTLFCKDTHCMFKIGRARLKEIISKKPKKTMLSRPNSYRAVSDEERNLSDLNNL